MIYKRLALCAVTLLLALFAHPVSTCAGPVRSLDVTGAYRVDGRVVYVGVDGEPPDHPTIEYYDSGSHRLGTLRLITGRTYRSDDLPVVTFDLASPTGVIRQRPFLLARGDDRFGFSLWYAAGAKHRPTILLIEGADDSTRQMGFLIPYFVAHGLNVVTYDQRGTGLSTGNWRYSGPPSKAQDMLALLQRVKSDPAVDGRRIGAWAASNGGWVAPIVAHDFPLAFLILKSASSETIVQNVLYEVEQDLRESKRFSPAQISAAMTVERTIFSSLQTNSNWGAAAVALNGARSQPWFSFMRIPPGTTAPPSPLMLAAFQASLIYDPAAMLAQLRTPTLALYGALDKDVDAADSASLLRSAFERSGQRDLTIVTFARAGHLLVASSTGYEDQPLLPIRYVGYPEAMIRWLEARGFANR